jgi:hypothetical protein
MVAPDSDNAEDLPQPSGPGTSAADGKLVGFSCPVCGYLRPAETRQPAPAPLCAGSKARTGRRHEPTPMVALLD